MTTKKTTRKTTATKKATTKGTTKGRSTKATKPAEAKPAKQPATKRLSALDAAAKVLAESKEPLNAKQMIDAMAEKKYWSSPGGKTPHATLYSAILREINTKGKDARFKKTERGKFTTNG
ncbi:winged helix-turn-helix domain-containing protein [Bremerella sp. P1]|uniref:winged helix-turn-helix domain-containing protein n=1 Tax=Bremerella sp. P1 TaxID=3026424 RepID=UPI002367C9C7|nr:winged helix-turn-helix domain-containing protein [Bremerella sp. P1]WDI41484.1 winged helix-turn-helix domain-containing protein [Bremerella sp. P1]